MRGINDCIECIGNGFCTVIGSGIRKGTEGITFDHIIFDQFFVWNNSDGLKISDEKIETLEIKRMHLGRAENISIPEVKRLTFRNCEFIYLPMIDHKNIWYVEFDNCTFGTENMNWAKNILAPSNVNKKVYLKECKIGTFHIGDIRDIRYNSNIELSYLLLTGGEIEELTIENVEIASKFYINKQYDGNNKQTKIGKLTIQNSIFKDNFKLHYCNVSQAIVKDSDFEKHADFYMSKFHRGIDDEDPTIYFKALNFKGLALFGDCSFYEKVVFRYITFEGYSHFRQAYFAKGLELDYANIQKEMNFFGATGLDSKESRTNTSQETYRIIKHNFDRLGNKIEANKYHSLELDTKRKHIFAQPTSWYQKCEEFVIYSAHWLFSLHSRSWLIPLLWIFVVSVVVDCSINVPYAAYSSFSEYAKHCIEYIFICHEYNPKYLSIFSSVDIEKYPKVFLFQKISLGYLYYQFLLAVRKDTKR